MARPISSRIHDRTLLEEALVNATSMKEVILNLGLKPTGGNYKALKESANTHNLVLPLWDKSRSGVKAATIAKMRSDEDIFCENSTYLNGASIKKRLYKMGVKEECTGCGLGPEWRGLPLTLQLEHINGVHNDNRLENLAILCPNCHSQTSTFAGKNIKVKTPPNLCQCGSQILKNSIRCNSCSASERESNTYPSTEELIAGVKARGFSAVGREIGVSDVAVRKHLKKVLGEEDLLFRR